MVVAVVTSLALVGGVGCTRSERDPLPSETEIGVGSPNADVSCQGGSTVVGEGAVRTSADGVHVRVAAEAASALVVRSRLPFFATMTFALEPGENLLVLAEPPGEVKLTCVFGRPVSVSHALDGPLESLVITDAEGHWREVDLACDRPHRMLISPIRYDLGDVANDGSIEEVMRIVAPESTAGLTFEPAFYPRSREYRSVVMSHGGDDLALFTGPARSASSLLTGRIRAASCIDLDLIPQRFTS
jgi:hypothetical protein